VTGKLGLGWFGWGGGGKPSPPITG